MDQAQCGRSYNEQVNEKSVGKVGSEKAVCKKLF